MKILHLSTFDTGTGAARGSQWLHDALRRRDIDSSMMVAKKISDDATIHPLPGALPRFAAKLRMQLDNLPLRAYRTTDESFWTLGWMPCRFDRLVAELQPDIVHLHWVGAGFMPISALRRFSCPIVWTLRDMWSFTGGCHYTAGCEKYRNGCGACPQLRSSSEMDLSRAIWQHKKRNWRDLDLWLVPISQWLGDCAAASPLLNQYPIEVIPNGLELSTFSQVDKATARASWDLPPDRPIALYGAINATRDARKGYAELVQALRILGSQESAKDMLLVIFGDLEKSDIPDCGIETRHVGYIDDNQRLSQLYAAADVAVMPSLQEAFGKTLIEAMACGTPVVAFDSGGPRDIVSHGIDGYLAEAFNPEDLARGIVWCFDQTAAGVDLGGAARLKVKAEFDIEAVADRYQALYQTILSQPERPASQRSGTRRPKPNFQLRHGTALAPPPKP